MNKYFVLFSYLIGCNDYSFGVVREPNPPTVTTTKKYIQPSPIPGKGLECTTNEQCGNDFFCYKDKNSYVGLCAKVLE